VKKKTIEREEYELRWRRKETEGYNGEKDRGEKDEKRKLRKK